MADKVAANPLHYSVSVLYLSKVHCLKYCACMYRCEDLQYIHMLDTKRMYSTVCIHDLVKKAFL